MPAIATLCSLAELSRSNKADMPIQSPAANSSRQVVTQTPKLYLVNPCNDTCSTAQHASGLSTLECSIVGVFI